MKRDSRGAAERLVRACFVAVSALEHTNTAGRDSHTCIKTHLLQPASTSSDISIVTNVRKTVSCFQLAVTAYCRPSFATRP